MPARFLPSTMLDLALAQATTAGRRRLAGKIADAAAASAPVESGKFAASIHAVTAGDDVAVVSSDEAAPHIEYGTSDTPPHATISNAARRYGQLRGRRA